MATTESIPKKVESSQLLCLFLTLQRYVFSYFEQHFSVPKTNLNSSLHVWMRMTCQEEFVN